MKNLIEISSKHFLNICASGKAIKNYPEHVYIVVNWTEILCERYKMADKEIAILGAWFHDIGNFIGENEDHAVNSESEVITFLNSHQIENEIINKVAHVVRSHRNRDIAPKTLEAKIVAAADSASHITAEVYLDIMKRQGKEVALAKLERDVRDIGFFPELKNELEPLYKGWEQLIKKFPTEFYQYIH